MPLPAMLRIAQHEGDPGYYLLYLATDARELTDTWHETLEGAMEQAGWEFQVKREDWRLAEN